MTLIFNVMLTLDAVSLFLVIYLTKAAIWIPRLGNYSVFVYLLVPFIVAGICLKMADKLSKDSIEGGLLGIELANDSFLPSYLGYFFVALSIPENQESQIVTIILVFGLIFIFLLVSQNLYYNPLFLLYGYRFYYVTNKKGMKIFIITKRELKASEQLEFSDLRRINYFTFIDKEQNKYESFNCESERPE